MKRLAFWLLLVIVTFPGCGGGYDIPEIDPEEARLEEEKINKAMEEEMERQMSGRRRRQ